MKSLLTGKRLATKYIGVEEPLLSRDRCCCSLPQRRDVHLFWHQRKLPRWQLLPVSTLTRGEKETTGYHVQWKACPKL